MPAEDNGFTGKGKREVPVLAGVAEYREAMRSFARQSVMTVWYAHLDVEDRLKDIKSRLNKASYKEAEKALAKAHTRDSSQALRKLTEEVDGEPRFISQPPVIVPIEQVFSGVDADALGQRLHDVLRRYRRTLQTDRRHLLEQFELKQVARKVVGVGSVGTRAWASRQQLATGSNHCCFRARKPNPQSYQVSAETRSMAMKVNAWSPVST